MYFRIYNIYFTPSLEVHVHRDGTDGIHLFSNYFYAKIKHRSKEIKERNSAGINSLEKNGQEKLLFSIQSFKFSGNAPHFKCSAHKKIILDHLYLGKSVSFSYHRFSPKACL